MSQHAPVVDFDRLWGERNVNIKRENPMSQQVRRTSKRNKLRRGQGLVEFALVIPILLLMIMGIVDFGWMVFNYAQLYNSMREGLRYGTVPGTGGTAQYYDCAGIKSTITNLAGLSGIKATDITITYDSGVPNSMGVANTQVGTCDSSFSPSLPAPRNKVLNGDRIVIHMNVAVPFLTPFIRVMFPSGLAITFDGARTLFPEGFPTY